MPGAKKHTPPSAHAAHVPPRLLLRGPPHHLARSCCRAQWEKVVNTTEALDALSRAAGNRQTACTKMNAESSRSHAVLMINITVKGGPRTLQGKLFLVDLAGSERVKKSGVGMELVEGKFETKVTCRAWSSF